MPAEWIAVGMSIIVPVSSGLVLWGKVTTTLRNHEDAMKAKIDRAEFDAGMKRLDELHRDLREIRDLLLKVLTKEAA